MTFSPERIGLFFAACGITLLGCFLYSPWREKQFDDYVAISANPVELGQVACFQKAQGEFTLTNLSNARIPFRVNADCSCTTLETTSGTLEPRSKHLVKFSYSPKSIARLDSSIQQEGSDISVSLLAKDTKFSKLVAVHADGVFPLIIDRYKLRVSVEPLQSSEVVVPFSTAKDVTNVRLVSAPSFFSESRVDATENALAFRANIEMPIGTHMGAVVLEFDVQNVSKPVRMDLPIAVVVEKPFAFSSDILALSPESNFLIEVRPKFGAMTSAYIKAETECPLLTTKVEGHSMTVTCGSRNGASLPVTGRLKISIRTVHSDGRELITDDDLPFTVSEGGSHDE